MTDKVEIAKRLREQKRTVEMMAYVLRLVCPHSASSIEGDAHCICAWIDDACDALSPQDIKND